MGHFNVFFLFFSSVGYSAHVNRTVREIWVKNINGEFKICMKLF